MCGIVGMVSQADVTQSTVQRLVSLEYRGYDSFGLASLGPDGFEVRKDVGSVGRALREGRLNEIAPASSALAHTRWATHGGVTPANAHPHLSFDCKVAVVHNGVIENHGQIRRELESNGIAFASQTDSEVVAHLIALYLDRGESLLDSIALTTRGLTGEYALGIVSVVDPHAIYGAKRKSPLVVSHNGEQGLLASDQMALNGVGEEAIFLEDGDIVRLHVDLAEVFVAGHDGRSVPVCRDSIRIEAQQEVVEKGNHPHWMIKEIHETPDAVEVALGLPADTFLKVIPAREGRAVRLIGAGSAFYVAQIGQYMLAQLAEVPAIALPADEAEYLALLSEGDPVIAISQSGETFDTLEICRAAVDTGAVLTSISNVHNSTQERLSSHRLQQGSGPEICVLSTKSIVSQVLLLARLALEVGRANGVLSDERYNSYYDSLARLPVSLRTLLTKRSADIQVLAKKYSHVEDWFFIGRGSLYPVACESALKFKEVSYRHAEGTSAGFFKHGTISLIDANFYTVALLPSNDTAHDRYAATLAAVSEIAARGGPVIGLGPENVDPDDLANFVDYLPLPYCGHDPSDIILQLVAGQLLAYFCALDLGREIDQPRSLAKSVTVR